MCAGCCGACSPGAGVCGGAGCGVWRAVPEAVAEVALGGFLGCCVGGSAVVGVRGVGAVALGGCGGGGVEVVPGGGGVVV